MLFLMSDILDFAQIEAKSFVLNITRCNVEDLLHECLNVFKLKAQEKNLDLSVQF
jgi:signal transduction histidine kinase